MNGNVTPLITKIGLRTDVEKFVEVTVETVNGLRHSKGL